MAPVVTLRDVKPRPAAPQARATGHLLPKVRRNLAAYGFLISERGTIPPSEPRSATLFKAPALPDSYRPRGAAVAA